MAEFEENQRRAGERLAQLQASRPRELPEMDMAQVANIISTKLETAPPVEVAQVLRGFIVSIVALKPKGEELTGTVTYRLPVLGIPGEYVVPL